MLALKTLNHESYNSASKHAKRHCAAPTRTLHSNWFVQFLTSLAPSFMLEHRNPCQTSVIQSRTNSDLWDGYVPRGDLPKYSLLKIYSGPKLVNEWPYFLGGSLSQTFSCAWLLCLLNFKIVAFKLILT